MIEVELGQILDKIANELIELVNEQTDFTLSDRTSYRDIDGREVSGYVLRIFAGSNVIGSITLTNKKIFIASGLITCNAIPYHDPDLFDKIIEIIKTI